MRSFFATMRWRQLLVLEFSFRDAHHLSLFWYQILRFVTMMPVSRQMNLMHEMNKMHVREPRQRHCRHSALLLNASQPLHATICV